jgi:hypothetical protein
MATLREMQHIDRTELYINLSARIKYLQSFVEWSNRQPPQTLTPKYHRAADRTTDRRRRGADNRLQVHQGPHPCHRQYRLQEALVI